MRHAALAFACAVAALAVTGISSAQQKARTDIQVPAVRHAIEFAGVGRTEVKVASETSFTFGAGTTPFVMEWIRDFVDGKPSRRSGYVFSITNRDEPITQTLFSRAAVAEVAFPPLDVTSREPVLVTVKFRAEKLDPQQVAGTLPLPRRDYEAATRKWVASGFRLRIDGVEAAKVTRVEALVFRQGPATAPALPKLVVTLAESEASANLLRQSGGPRTAILELLPADRGRPYVTLRFDGVAVTKMEPVGEGTARRMRAEMTLAKAQLSFAP